MGDNDKPFACNFPGCGQTFTNNDRLVVHRQTHTLSLKIGRRGDDNITDQTPTPTRFLRNCDEEGLFEELGGNVDENPFDRDFKSATKPTDKKSTVNTPVPTITPALTTERSTKNARANKTDFKQITTVIAADHVPPAIQTVVIDGTVPNAAEFLLQAAARQADKKMPESPKVSVLVTNNGDFPKAIPAFIANPGKQVPKAIPAPTQVIQLSIPTPAIVISPTANPKPSFIKSAKQKLKETIRIHQAQGKDIPRADMNNIISQAMDEAATSCKRPSENNNEDSNVDEKKPVKRSRKSQEDLTPDAKREKFLERNRAAATRCREKRKVWIVALEKKAEEMSDANSHLQNEISCLKHEVAQLKALLLAHRDCPLAIKQQKLNPQFFQQLESSPIIIDFSNQQQSTEETAATLAQMATINVQAISNGS